MKGLESGKDKVKKICEVLKKETLEPAKKEAEEILHQAHATAETIISQAHEKAKDIESAAKKEIERQRNVFQSSLNQACKQSIESLKQEIENKLFSKELSNLITTQTQDPKVIAELVTAVVKAIEKEGINSDITAYVSSVVPAKTINGLLTQNVLQRLKEKEVLLGSMQGGVAVKLHKENITLDITDIALKELVSQYIRKDFRDMLFVAN
ncbi:MAG: V-type ATP synthase subunit E [Chlamydiae bacterium]|nr:V-type ATP synthase subunit E [Chlamydiota bacterium]